MDPRTREAGDPDGAKIHLPLGLFKISSKRGCEKKHAKIKERHTHADPRPRDAGDPERAKIYLPLGLFEIFDDVLAAQVPRGSVFTSVASGPHTLRPKDCPGLGSPNTLKLAFTVQM